jgi:hypothetical protein
MTRVTAGGRAGYGVESREPARTAMNWGPSRLLEPTGASASTFGRLGAITCDAAAHAPPPPGDHQPVTKPAHGRSLGATDERLRDQLRAALLRRYDADVEVGHRLLSLIQLAEAARLPDRSRLWKTRAGLGRPPHAYR